MKETWLTGKRRSTTITATPDDGKARGKEEEVSLGTVFRNSGSCMKLISISFDLSELIFMPLCTVHLAAMSTECCKTDSLFL